MRCTNRIWLTGEVIAEPVYKYATAKMRYYEMEIATTRLSGNKDIIPVSLRESMLKRHMPQVGERVHVTGHIRATVEADKADGCNHLYLVASAMELRPPVEDDADNEVYVEGTIAREVMYHQTPFAREIAETLLVVEGRNGWRNRIPIIAWGKNARMLATLGYGDFISARGRLQSRTFAKTLEDGSKVQRTIRELSIRQLDAAPLEEEDNEGGEEA